MNKLLLLGAGFSRNWGGWLASEAFEYLVGCPEVISSPYVSNLLWRQKNSGGFEASLATIQADWKRAPNENQAHLDALQGAVKRMYFAMNTAFLEQIDFEFQNDAARLLRRALVQFDAIFTLNQDLLLEHHYLNDNVSLTIPGRWDGFQLPGLTPQQSQTFANVPSTANRDWVPSGPEGFQVAERVQPYFKLHGSSNWIDPDGSPLLIMGGNKEGDINDHPLLAWYQQEFERYLSEPNSRLLVIGYGFHDAHINRAITSAAEQHGLKLFIIDPLGADLPWTLNMTRRPGQIGAATPLEALFQASVIGASRRSLGEIFGGDAAEHAKVMRFIEE